MIFLCSRSCVGDHDASCRAGAVGWQEGVTGDAGELRFWVVQLLFKGFTCEFEAERGSKEKKDQAGPVRRAPIVGVPSPVPLRRPRSPCGIPRTGD